MICYIIYTIYHELDCYLINMYKVHSREGSKSGEPEWGTESKYAMKFADRESAAKFVDIHGICHYRIIKYVPSDQETN